MRFGLVHRILLDTLVALGMLALVATGEFGQLGSWTLVAALAIGMILPARWQERKGLRLFGTYAPVVLLGVQLLRWADGNNPLTIAVEFAAVLQVIWVATRRGAAHDQQLIALALLHLIAATVLGGGLSFAICFVGFILVTPSALVLSHLRREVEGNYRQGARDRTGLPVDVPRILRSRRVISRGYVAFISLLSLPVFAVTALIFVAFPRVGLSLLLLEPHRSSRMVGFSDRIDLGGIGALESDPKIAMRVQYPVADPAPPKRIALYLRGTALDRYQGKSWSRSQNERKYLENSGAQYAITRFPDPARDASFTIELEPIEPPLLFVPEHTAAIELLPHSNQALVDVPAIFQGAESDLHYARLDDRRGPRYRVFLQNGLALGSKPLTALDRQRYLQLDPAVTSRLGDLAKTWAGNETDPLIVANRIMTRLRKDYRYDLNSPSSKSPNPIEHFLFDSKRGHCEYYSTAMALLLRTQGIPSRNVTGFAGATYNRYGRFYAVRQGDAHSWVEAWIEGVGWKRFDPTPAAAPRPPDEYERIGASLREVIEAMSQRWTRHVERYDLRQQMELFGGLRRGARVATEQAVYFKSPKRAGALLVAAIALLLLGKYLRQANKRAPKSPTEPGLSASTQEVIRLYQQLERLLTQRGLGRHPAVPPLAHARALVATQQPLSAEILELTKTYLAARFGEAQFGLEESRQFSEAVARLSRTPASEWERGSPDLAANSPAPKSTVK